MPLIRIKNAYNTNMARETLLAGDRIYGEKRIENPVISALVLSEPMQRLKKLNQFGLPDEFYHLKGFSQYEHSLGVMYLLQHLGTSEEEQVAGLLHDVSHRAFSHVYNWVVGTQAKRIHKMTTTSSLFVVQK